MRKLLLGAAAAVVMAASPAIADVKVDVKVRSHKDKIVLELVEKLKIAHYLVVVVDEGEAMSESVALVNQFNTENFACENCAEKESIIDGSLNGNEGIVSVNQATGNMNNQGTAVAFAFNAGPAPNGEEDDDDITGFADALAAAGQVNADNEVDSVNILFRDSVINESGNNSSGLLYVNQAAGNINNQANVLSAAVSQAEDQVGGIALSEADLGQVNTNNIVFERNVNKTASITGSFNANSGVIGVNQTSGNFANQANVLSLSVAQ